MKDSNLNMATTLPLPGDAAPPLEKPKGVSDIMQLPVNWMQLLASAPFPVVVTRQQLEHMGFYTVYFLERNAWAGGPDMIPYSQNKHSQGSTAKYDFRIIVGRYLDGLVTGDTAA